MRIHCAFSVLDPQFERGGFRLRYALASTAAYLAGEANLPKVLNHPQNSHYREELMVMQEPCRIIGWAGRVDELRCGRERRRARSGNRRR